MFNQLIYFSVNLDAIKSIKSEKKMAWLFVSVNLLYGLGLLIGYAIVIAARRFGGVGGFCS